MTAPVSDVARQPSRMQIAILLTNWYGPAIVRAFLPTHELRRQAWTVHQQIADRETPSVARAWMIGRNPQLDDQEPIRAIAAGHVRDVEIAARAYLQHDRDAEADAAHNAIAGGLDNLFQRIAPPPTKDAA